MKLLKFWASWCNPCKQQTKEFERNPLSVELQSIDCENPKNQDLVEKFKVRNLPYMVLVNDNNEIINNWTGLTKSSIINSYVSNLA